MNDWAIFGLILLIVILVFVFLTRYAPRFAETTMELDFSGKKFRVKTSQNKGDESAINKLDPNVYHVDSKNGFAFKMPSKEHWNGPKYLHGMSQKFQDNDLVFHPDTEEQMKLHDEITPMGQLRKMVDIIKYESGDSVKMEVTEETSSAAIDYVLNNARKMAEERGEPVDESEFS